MKCSITEAERARIIEAIYWLPSQMRGELTPIHGDVEKLKGTRRGDTWRLKQWPYRVFFRAAAGEILVLLLDRRDDHTYDDITAIERIVVARSGSGVQVVEVADNAAEPAPEPARSIRPATTRERENPLTLFTTPQLEQIGLDRESIKIVRTLSPSIDVAEVLAERALQPDAVELVADMWQDRDRYLAIFDSGRVPTIEDARIDESELAERLRSDDSMAAIAALDESEFEAVLTRSIEEWMFYLHPSQSRIVRHHANGPSRVQGGPGTGKTVAALHRARHLVETGQAERVLLTTFVNLLPGVWRTLLATFAPEVASAITTRTVDSLARGIVVEVDGEPGEILASGGDERRKILERVVAQTLGLREVIGAPGNFEREIDAVIAGRGLDLDAYLTVEREGSGKALRQADRRLVWDGYERYRSLLATSGRIDWPHLRLRALGLARDGAGPRHDAVVVDEAQDLTETQVRLLMEIDTSVEHRGLMLVGDGRQAIYPGGFRLAHVGLRVGGRSFTLDRNWRNTQWIAEAAQAALGESEFVDLETGDMRKTASEQALPIRLGDPPQLHVVNDSADGREVMLMLVDEALKSGGLDDIGVLGRTKKTLDWAEKTLRDAGHRVVRLDDYKGQPVDAIRVGTFAKSKGLEFKLVILAAAGKAGWAVKPFWLREAADIDEWWATELRTFYVAMTRARDRLAVLTAPELSPPIVRARELFDEWDWR